MVDGILEFYKSRRGLRLRTQWRWRVIAANGEILSGSSESYDNRGDAVEAAEMTAEIILHGGREFPISGTPV